MLRFIKKYLRDKRAATAIAFALAIPVVIGSAGMAIDVANGYLIKQRLTHALDAAAVAAAASSNEGGNLEAKVNQFFYQNYPPEKLGAITDLDISQVGTNISVSATARYNTYFAQFLGIEEMDVSANTTVAREILGLEVALVLDVTGSMNDEYYDPEEMEDVANIQALRKAATSFTNILFNAAVFQDTIKIGLVPYSTSVNVGPYGLGFDLNGEEYDTAFVNNPNDLDYYNPQAPRSNPQANVYEDNRADTQWRGCIIEREYPDDTEDADNWWRWDMYRYTFRYHRNNYYRQYYCKRENWRGECVEYDRVYNYYDDYYARNADGRNYICNKSHILPLTNDRDEVNYQIAKLKASGNTVGNIGMVWGYRLVSPQFPFREGAAYNDPEWKKAVVMMTDGDNYIDDNYSGYGGYTQTDVHSAYDVNERFAETCENMKDQGIIIYTVTFSSGISDNTRDYYRECATDPDKYINAPTQSDLVAAFEQISRELSNVHIIE